MVLGTAVRPFCSCMAWFASAIVLQSINGLGVTGNCNLRLSHAELARARALGPSAVSIRSMPYGPRPRRARRPRDWAITRGGIWAGTDHVLEPAGRGTLTSPRGCRSQPGSRDASGFQLRSARFGSLRKHSLIAHL